MDSAKLGRRWSEEIIQKNIPNFASWWKIIIRTTALEILQEKEEFDSKLKILQFFVSFLFLTPNFLGKLEKHAKIHNNCSEYCIVKYDVEIISGRQHNVTSIKAKFAFSFKHLQKNWVYSLLG